MSDKMTDDSLLVIWPVAWDSNLQRQRRIQLDGTYQRVADDSDKLLILVGLKLAA